MVLERPTDESFPIVPPLTLLAGRFTVHRRMELMRTDLCSGRERNHGESSDRMMPPSVSNLTSCFTS